MFQNLIDAIVLEAAYQWHAIGIIRPLSRAEYVKYGSMAGYLYRNHCQNY